MKIMMKIMMITRWVASLLLLLCQSPKGLSPLLGKPMVTFVFLLLLQSAPGLLVMYLRKANAHFFFFLSFVFAECP